MKKKLAKKMGDQPKKEQRFWQKLLSFGKKIGEKTVYYSLLLYYTAKNPAIPKSTKMIIVGALAYLIFPIDLIPDFIPVIGFADDSAVIAAAVYKVFTHIDEHAKNQAKEKLALLFGDDVKMGIEKE